MLSPPPPFCCPISLSLMHDPVTLPSGITCDRPSIQHWLDRGHSTCPSTMTPLGPNPHLIPNFALRRLIQEWCVGNQSSGVEGISTPAPPAAEPETVLRMLEVVSLRGPEMLSSLRRLRALAKSSERNQRCLEAVGVDPVLADLMGTETTDLDRENVEALQEALGTLVLLPLSPTTRNALLRKRQLETISWLLTRGTIGARVNAAKLLETLAIDRCAVKAIGAADEAIDGLVGLLKESLYSAAANTSLKTLLALCRAPLKDIKLLIVAKGAVPALIELLPGTERSTAERILALLKALCSFSEGRAATIAHALAIPALVRSLLVVSDVANEQALGALWAICLNATCDETLEEAIQMGAREKLLVLAQMNCADQTKHLIKDLLKAFSKIDHYGDALSTFHRI